MDLAHETQKLIDSRLLRTEQEIQQFEQAIVNIVGMKKAEHIKHLCLGFDDSTECDEVMFGLIHAIESYDKVFGAEESLKNFAESLPSMLPHAKGWVKILHKRILNDAPSRKAYAKVVSKVDVNVKNLVVQIINEIKEKNPGRFEASALEFLS
ncbi:Imm30 family immunity protein [Geobacillus sp. FSL W8-0032]|uniref:Immunity protein 30 domain-containing protein n=2 Tax=Anoxybacillaceae TaxID=3120669 RepID=A0ABU6BGZ0_9BACL|nr:Imm30 family immunity protein [Geobacillus icigianus]MEB3751166.1 hypothetical protein [Geobacillus icigianus]